MKKIVLIILIISYFNCNSQEAKLDLELLHVKVFTLVNNYRVSIKVKPLLKDAVLKEAIDQINSGYFSHLDVNTFKELTDSLMYDDQYLLFADFQSYLEAQEKAAEAFKHKEMWAKMSILNTARMGKFSSDRSIREYCDEIWKVKSVPVEIDSIKIIEK